MQKDKRNILSQTKIAKIAECSRSTVNLVLNCSEIENKDLASRIYELAKFDNYLLELFLDKDFYEICEVAIAKARKPSIRKKAVLLQNASENLRYKLELTNIDRTKEEE